MLGNVWTSGRPRITQTRRPFSRVHDAISRGYVSAGDGCLTEGGVDAWDNRGPPMGSHRDTIPWFQSCRLTQSSIRRLAMLRGGGISGKLSALNHLASTISSPSIWISPDNQVAKKPIIKE
jgi:hypothetical protein